MLQNTQYNDNGSVFSTNQAITSKSVGSINQGTGTILEGTKFVGNSVGGSQGIMFYNLLNDITFKGVNVTLSAGKNYLGNLIDTGETAISSTNANGQNKNFYVIASTVAIENSMFNDDNPGDESSDVSKGGYFYLFE